jgi:hypothetical protein
MHYFRVETGSEMDAHLVRMNEIHKARVKGINKACKELRIPHGATPFGCRDRILGFGNVRFDPPIVGWKWVKKYRCNMPDTKTPEGKIAKALLAAIPKDVDNMKESSAVFNHDLVFGTMGGHSCIMCAGFAYRRRKSGYVGIVSMRSGVKAAAKKWPTGLVEITATEAEKHMNGPKTRNTKAKKGEEELI